MEEMNAFLELIKVNVNDHTEKKSVGGKELTYLSWPWAWSEIKKRYPDADYKIWRNPEGLPYVFDPNTGYMVFTSVTIEDTQHSMWLSVMDGANNAMKDKPYEYKVKNPKFRYAKKQPDGRYLDNYGNEQPEYIVKTVEAATMTDINKTIMRCLVKNLAMFGLGLYIYAGEDLPEGETPDVGAQPVTPADNVRPTENVVPITRPNVSIADKLPPKPEQTELEVFILKAMGEFRRQRNCSAAENKKIFNAQYEALRKAQLIADKDMKDFTLEEAAVMVDAMQKCFDLNGTELKTE